MLVLGNFFERILVSFCGVGMNVWDSIVELRVSYVMGSERCIVVVRWYVSEGEECEDVMGNLEYCEWNV